MEHKLISNSAFEGEGDFCSECGAILRLDHININARCVVCHHETSLKNVLGVKYSYEIDFTPLGHYSHLKHAENEKEAREKENNVGQMDNDRECSSCGHKGMSYTTMQLRSADEGQTVFYFCSQCKHREVENS